MWIHSSDGKEELSKNLFLATIVMIPILCVGSTFLLSYSFETTINIKSVAPPLISDVAELLYLKQPDVDVFRFFNKLDNAIINGTLPTFDDTITNALLGIGTMLGIGSNIVSTSWAALAFILGSNIIGGIAIMGIVTYLNRVINEFYSGGITTVSSTVHKREPNMASRDLTFMNVYKLMELPLFRENIGKAMQVRENIFQATEPMSISAFTVFGVYMLLSCIFCGLMTRWMDSGIFETDFHKALEYIQMIDNKVFIGEKFWQQVGIVLGLPCQILYVLSIVLMGEFVVTRLTELFGLTSRNDPHLFICDYVLFSLTTEGSHVHEKWDDHGGPDVEIVFHLKEQSQLEYRERA